MTSWIHKAICSTLPLTAFCVSCVGPNPDYLEEIPGGAPKRLFVTAPMLRGRYVSDDMCRAAAAQGGLGGTWIGWYSMQGAFEIDAVERIQDVGPWFDLRGSLIFRDKGDLSQLPLNPIRVTERSYALDDDEPIWTGTRPGGTSGSNRCLDATQGVVWGSNQPTVYGDIGLVGRTDERWTYAGAQTCDQEAHLICIEQ